MSQEISVNIPLSLFQGKPVDEVIANIIDYDNQMAYIERLQQQVTQLKSALRSFGRSLDLIAEEVSEFEQVKARRTLAQEMVAMGSEAL